MTTKWLAGTFALLALVHAGGCGGMYLSPAASQALGNIKVGMSREEVVRQLGPPHNQEMIGNTQLLTYNADWTMENTAGSLSPIAIVDDKVVGLGPSYAFKVKFDYQAETAANK
jgi:hypothetical protein